MIFITDVLVTYRASLLTKSARERLALTWVLTLPQRVPRGGVSRDRGNGCMLINMRATRAYS